MLTPRGTLWTSTRSRASSDGRVLREEVREDLLRGVRVDVALRSFGRYFSVPDGSLAGMDPEDFTMSTVVQHLDDFLSHEWQTGRWPKLCALCAVYNGNAAVALSFVVAVTLSFCMSVCDIRKPLKDSIALWGFLVPASVFWGVFFFGQRLRRAVPFLRSRMLFVDRLCINQMDELDKQEGICSLAGFMRASDRLILLWTPRYFTRLWCVYEMATWLHLGRDLVASTTLMPVNLAMGFIVVHVCLMVLCLVVELEQVLWVDLPAQYVPMVVAMLVVPWGVHALRRLSGELHQLGPQVASFSIRDAKCFCCTHGHIHPVTMQLLPCDRRLVYSKLRRRSAGGDVSPLRDLDQCLNDFDALVRSKCRDLVSQVLGTARITYSQALFMTVPAAWFGATAFPDVTNGAPLQAKVRVAALYLSMFLSVMPCLVKVLVAATLRSVTVCGPRGSRLLDMLTSAGIALLAPAYLLVLWLPTWYAFTFDSIVPLVCTLVAHALLTCVVFSGTLRHRCRRQAVAASRGAAVDAEEFDVAEAGGSPVAAQKTPPHDVGVLPGATAGSCALGIAPPEERPGCKGGSPKSSRTTVLDLNVDISSEADDGLAEPVLKVLAPRLGTAPGAPVGACTFLDNSAEFN